MQFSQSTFVCMYVCMYLCTYIRHTLISVGSQVAHVYRHVRGSVYMNASAAWMDPDGTWAVSTQLC